MPIGAEFGGPMVQFPGQTFDPFNVNASNPLLKMAAGQGALALAGMTGRFPGAFLPGQNPYDQMRAANYFEGMNESQRQAAAGEAKQIRALILGGAKIAGVDITPEMRQTIEKMGDDGAVLMPYLASLAPDLADQLLGRKGSQTVFNATMFRVGQHMTDAGTGATGLTATSSAGVSQLLFNRMFGEGANIDNMAGASMGQTAGMFEGLARRGLMPAGVGMKSQRDRAQMAADADFSVSEIQSMAGVMANREGITENEALKRVVGATHRVKDIAAGRVPLAEIDKNSPINDLFRQLDARKQAAKLQEMAPVRAVAREMLVEAGYSPAQITEDMILQTAQNFTQQGLSSRSAESVRDSLRLTQSLAKSSGLGLEAMQALSANAAHMAETAGVSRGFAEQITQGAAAFVQASRDTSNTFGGSGGLSQEELGLKDMQLRAQAAASPRAREMAALVRMYKNGDIKEGTDAASMAKAIMAGDSSFRRADGTQQSVSDVSGASLRDTVVSGGGSASDFVRLQEKSERSDATIKQNRIQDQVRGEQSKEIIDRLGREMTNEIGGKLNEWGVKLPQSQQVAVGKQIAEAIVKMDPEDRKDETKRSAVVAKAGRDALADQGVKVNEQQSKSLGMLAEDRASMFAEREGYKSEAGLGQLHEQETIERVRTNQQQGAAEGRTRDAFAHMSTDPVRRVAERIMTATGDESIKDLLSTLAGGIDPRMLESKDPVVQEVLKQTKIAADAANDAEGMKAKQQAGETVVALHKGGAAAASQIDKIRADAEGRPLTKDEQSTIDALTEAQKSETGITKRLEQAGVRGAVADQMAAAEKEKQAEAEKVAEAARKTGETVAGAAGAVKDMAIKGVLTIKGLYEAILEAFPGAGDAEHVPPAPGGGQK